MNFDKSNIGSHLFLIFSILSKFLENYRSIIISLFATRLLGPIITQKWESSLLIIIHLQNLKELEAKIELWVNGKEGFVEPVLVAASASSTENQGLTQQNNTYFCSFFFFFLVIWVRLKFWFCLIFLLTHVWLLRNEEEVEETWKFESFPLFFFSGFGIIWHEHSAESGKNVKFNFLVLFLCWKWIIHMYF